MAGSRFTKKGEPGKKPKSSASDLTLDIMNKNGIPQVDWEVLCHEWVMTAISLRGLAEKYGLSYRMVKLHHHNNNWKQKLEEYNAMVEEGLQNIKAKKAKEMADRIADLDDKILETSAKVVDLIEDQINAVGSPEPQFEKLDAVVGILKDAVKTLKDAHYNIRLSGDKATSIIEQNNSISSSLTEKDEERIASELGFVRKSKDKFIPDEESSETVVDDQSPQEPQE